MNRDPGASPSGWRSWKSWAIALGSMILGGFLTILVVYVLMVTGKADLEPWHRIDLAEWEFHSGDEHAPSTLAGYLELEERLFEELDTALSGVESDIGVLSRFSSGGPTNPSSFERNWNKTFVLGPSDPLGGALLLHGLSDSPYSWHAMGTILADNKYRVIGLRIPGHGTVPGAMGSATWKDWRAAVRLAVIHLVGELDEGEPLVLGGYSNGAALALDYTLAAINDPGLRVPDRLVFISPAFFVTRMAALARWQLLTSRLPGLEKMAWNSVLPEYDPFKYNSFALNGGKQIYELTTSVEERLARRATAGGMGQLPPVLTFQSVMDSTVPPVDSLTRLYGRIESNESALVLFDVNRRSVMQMFLSGAVDTVLDAATRREVYPFDITLVTNENTESACLVARNRYAGASSTQDEALDLAWPRGVYSLSHVALPFPPDDPVYGMGEGEGVLPIGGLEPRGEKGALLVPSTLLLRLRYNPFFDYVERRTLEFLELAESEEAAHEPPSSHLEGVAAETAN